MSQVAELTYEGRDLEAMSSAINYHRWIVEEFDSYVRGAVIEVGAGTGELSWLLLTPRVTRLVAVEPSANLVPQLRDRLAFEERAQVVHGFAADVLATDADFHFDTAVYVNVLEHIEDHAAELALVYDMLRPGGHVCILVPALPALYSNFDRSIGHFRRYTREELIGVVGGAGFSIEKAYYLDAVGIIPWYVAFVLLQQKLATGQVALYDRLAIPIVRRMEAIVRPPIGKNLLVVGRKTFEPS